MEFGLELILPAPLYELCPDMRVGGAILSSYTAEYNTVAIKELEVIARHPLPEAGLEVVIFHHESLKPVLTSTLPLYNVSVVYDAAKHSFHLEFEDAKRD